MHTHCPTRKTGTLTYQTKDLPISRNKTTIVPNLSGLFCSHCDEVLLDDTTTSATRYAAAGNQLILSSRSSKPNS